MAHVPSPIYDTPHQAEANVSIRVPARLVGVIISGLVFLTLISLATWSVNDPSFSYASNNPVQNWLGFSGSVVADFAFQFFGLAAFIALISPGVWGWRFLKKNAPQNMPLRFIAWMGTIILMTGLFSCFSVPQSWPLPSGLGGLIGSIFTNLATKITGSAPEGAASILYALILTPPTLALLWLSLVNKKHIVTNPHDGDHHDDTQRPERAGFLAVVIGGTVHLGFTAHTAWKRAWANQKARSQEADAQWQEAQEMRNSEPSLHTATPETELAYAPDHIEPPADEAYFEAEDYVDYQVAEEHHVAPPVSNVTTAPHGRVEPSIQARPLVRTTTPTIGDSAARHIVENGHGAPQNTTGTAPTVSPRVTAPASRPAPGARLAREAQGSLLQDDGFELPALDLLSEPKHAGTPPEHMPDRLEETARLLEGVLEDFGVKGDIINVRPGPVVTLYELEPAPGIKSSRVISLADDIARSMSAISARVAVVPGRNAIGIELPNNTRETVFLREMLASVDFEKTKGKLNICLGKTIGGEPIIADLARMPHLLVAGTTGSGKSVAINTMILSLLYKLSPEQCRMIMIDPKMLELSIYDGIPHLLTPVVTDPAKAVVALKWAVREMEDRYRKMSKIGVRNIDGFNTRVKESKRKGEVITRTVQTGFNKETGEAIFESEQFDLEPLPFIVIIVDEMADLMMVAGKDIEGAIQRLAQMARAAGIHIITATQRPSVDVITGTIKANFPTRISFQVTSKIDSRTILGEQGAEQLLGMGDMLYMAGGGRIRRLHGPFVGDEEVEDVVRHLKSQGTPDYLESVTEEDEEQEDTGTSNVSGKSGDDLYDKAINIVLNDQKASTSYIQRRLSIGYNRAATLIEKMEKEGVISPANHAGKREILVGDGAAH